MIFLKKGLKQRLGVLLNRPYQTTKKAYQTTLKLQPAIMKIPETMPKQGLLNKAFKRALFKGIPMFLKASLQGEC